MSQQELERTDQEVMDLVNRSATPEAKACAEEIAEEMREPTPEELAAEEAEKRYEAEIKEEKRKVRAYHRRRRICKILGVAACVVIAALLVIALFVPSFIICVVNGGVLICGIVAAIIIDRWLRWR